MKNPQYKNEPVGITSFAPNCLSIDLEVGIKDSRIHQFSAIRGNNYQCFSYSEGSLNTALTKLDQFAEGLSFLLGHNIIRHDLPHLVAVKPDLRLLKLPVVDTLRLNPLAYPR